MSTSQSHQPTFYALIRSFTTFLTIAIHTILYERSLYPSTSFLSARRYNFPVRQNRHPQVCTWINDAVSSVHDQLLVGGVKSVALVIVSAVNKPLERFLFDVSRFPKVPREEWGSPLERLANGNNIAGDEHAQETSWMVDLEEQMRATVSKLSTCGTLLKPLPKGCTFTLAIEKKDEADPPMGHPQPWIPIQPTLQVYKAQGDYKERKVGEDVGGVKTMPVRSVEAGEMVFEVWIEEGKAKFSDPTPISTDESCGNLSSSI